MRGIVQCSSTKDTGTHKPTTRVLSSLSRADLFRGTASSLDHPCMHTPVASCIDCSRMHWSKMALRPWLPKRGQACFSAATPESVKLGATGCSAACRHAVTCGRQFQDWKSQKYRDLIGSGEVVPRPGVLRLMDEARALGLKVAVCSAATKGSVIFTLESLLGKDRFAALDCFLAGDDVDKKKPDPTIYRAAAGAQAAALSNLNQLLRCSNISTCMSTRSGLVP
jgi:hypothetical protein